MMMAYSKNIAATWSVEAKKKKAKKKKKKYRSSSPLANIW